MTRRRATHRSAAALLAALGLLLTGCAHTQRPPARSVPFPSPLAGPGVPGTTDQQRELLGDGWRHLLADEPDAALAAAREAGKHPAASLLAYQVALADGAPGLLEPLRELAEAHPDWAAARATLSVAAERAGDDASALGSARETARLWPDRRWRKRLEELRRSLIAEPVARARELWEAGQSAEALRTAARVLELDPDNTEALKLRGLALIDEGEPERAEEILAALSDDPEAQAAAAELAGARGDWATAMQRYRSLPASWPGRGEALDHAALAWRLQNMPPYVREASRSERLTRAQLAVLLAALAPDLAAFATGGAPLMPDIVGRPDQQAILTAVRADLLRPDPVSHQFQPDAPVPADRVRSVLDDLAALLDAVPIRWCGDDPDPEQPCRAMGEPTGTAVTDALLQLASGGGAG